MNKLAVLAYVSALINMPMDMWDQPIIKTPKQYSGIIGGLGKFKKRKKVGNFFTPKVLAQSKLKR